MKNIFLPIFIFLTLFSFSQNKAEKQVLSYINHVRTNPQQFSEDVALPYMKEKELLRNRYAKSLIKELRQLESLDSLKFESSLQNMSKDFAEKAGKRGWVKHVRVDKRFDEYAEHVDITAENLQFGFDNPLDIVMDLLIDIDIPNLGHRKNILDPDFSIIGITIGKHKDFDFITVMNFGGFE